MYVVIELFVSALEEKNKLQNKLLPKTISNGTKILDILLLEGLCPHILTSECFYCVFGWFFCLLRSALIGYSACCIFSVSSVSIVGAYCSTSSTFLVASECSIFC